MSTLLELNAVSFRYPDGSVGLDGCSLRIERGSVLPFVPGALQRLLHGLLKGLRDGRALRGTRRAAIVAMARLQPR